MGAVSRQAAAEAGISAREAEVLDQFAPGTGPPVGAQRELAALVKATLTIAAINQEQ